MAGYYSSMRYGVLNSLMNSIKVIRMMAWLQFVLPCFCSDSILSCRAQYTEVSSAVGIEYSNVGYMPSGLSTIDFNNDGWDDLTLGTDQNGVITFLNEAGVLVQTEILPEIDGVIRSVFWLDLDGDGDLDFFANRYFSWPVMLRNDGGLSFSDVSYLLTMPVYDARTSTVSWADYDRDGLLDAYFSNYYMMGGITNWLFHNDGNFMFSDVTLNAGISDGVKTTYQSTWIDYDLDGWIDLFVSNDRMMGNTMYRNLGDGTFQDVGGILGLNVNMDGMGLSFDDFDNDLDYDVYVANTEVGSMLMKQTDGFFEDVAGELGIACEGTISWGVQWTDAMNDGLMDLYVVNDFPSLNNNQNYFFYQMEDGSFSQDIESDFIADDNESYALGELDLNNDGFMDLVVVDPAPASVQLWLQDTGNNNWLKIQLDGESSNQHGIGASILVYSGDRTWLRATHAGESFLAQNPFYETFGLGELQMVDSVAVFWPSGNIQMFYDIDVNALNILIEDEEMLYTQFLNLTLCEGESVVLSPGNFENYEWWNGSNDSQIMVDTTGNFSVDVQNVFGGWNSFSFNVTYIPLEIPDSFVSHPSCFNGSDGLIQLNDLSPDYVVVWSDGSTGQQKSNLVAGTYEYTLINDFGCAHTEMIDLINPPPLELVFQFDTACFGHTTEIVCYPSGGSGNLVLQWPEVDPSNVPAGWHSVSVFDEMGCVKTDSVNVVTYTDFEVELSAPVSCAGEAVAIDYSATGESLNYEFDFDEVDPDACFPGDYIVVVYDEHFCLQVFPFEVELNPTLTLTLEISESDETIISLPSGGTPPYVFNWTDGSSGELFSFETDGVYGCEITDANGCNASASIEVTAIEEIKQSAGIRCYPIPFNDQLFIETSDGCNLRIFSIDGKCLLELSSYDRYSIDTTAWPPGMYIAEAGLEKMKIIKQ